MSGIENVQPPLEATIDLHERRVNDILGSLGCTALFFTNVVLSGDTPSRIDMGVSTLCLVAVANFVGGVYSKANQSPEDATE